MLQRVLHSPVATINISKAQPGLSSCTAQASTQSSPASMALIKKRYQVCGGWTPERVTFKILECRWLTSSAP